MCRIHRDTWTVLRRSYIFLSFEKYENQIIVIKEAEFIVRRYGPPEVCLPHLMLN